VARAVSLKLEIAEGLGRTAERRVA